MIFDEYKYERPDLNKFNKKINSLGKKLKEEKDLGECFKLIDEFNVIKSHFQSMEQLVSIRNSCNTDDEYYDKEQEFFNSNSSKAKVAINNFNDCMLNHKYIAEFENKYGKQWFNLMRLEKKCFSEIIVDDLVEEAKLVTKYEKLLASAKIDFQGKTNNLSQMSVYAQNLDRNIRKEAEKKKAEYMSSIQPDLDSIYDSLVKVRTKMAKKMGYDNYLEFGYYRLGRSDYNYKNVRHYRDIIYKDVVPFAKELIAKQEKNLGLDKIKTYDLALQFKEGNPKPSGTVDELINKAYKMYSELSSQTGEFFKFMEEHKLLDLTTRPAKVGGGYTTYIPEFKSPFIFSNFNGTSGDVDVLTHEAGHAFEVYSASKTLNVSDIFWPTLEACEIHSMSMEFFTHPWMEMFFDKEADKYRYSHLIESILFLPYGATVDEFQEFVYLNPEATPKERNLKWREIEKKYTPYKDFDGVSYYENGGFWQRQQHIYTNPLYYIDYTLAQVCAFNFYIEDLSNHEKAFKKYYDLCLLGGSKSFFDLLKASDIKNPFDDGVVANCMKELKNIIKVLEKKI